jgi:hypothetical protein
MSTDTSSKQCQERPFTRLAHARSFTRLARTRFHTARTVTAGTVANTLFKPAYSRLFNTADARLFNPNPSKTDVRPPNSYGMNMRERIEFSETPILRTMVNTADVRLFFYCTDTQSYTIIMLSSSGGHHVNHPLVMSSSCLVMSINRGANAVRTELFGATNEHRRGRTNAVEACVIPRYSQNRSSTDLVRRTSTRSITHSASFASSPSTGSAACTSLFKNAPPFNTADEMLFFYRVERTHNHDDIIILL